MFKKATLRFLDFLREEYKIIIFFIIFYLVITFPVPYYVFTSGGITDLSQRFEIENGYKQTGSYNLSYVNQLNGNVLTYFLSIVVPGYERVDVGNYQVNENESIEEMSIRDKLSLESANQNAVIIAYQKAGKEVKINGFNMYIMATYDLLDSSETIKIGDILLKINDKEIKTEDDIVEFENIVANSEYDSYLTLELSRNGDVYTTEVKVNNYENRKVLGLMFFLDYDYEVDPKIEFKFGSGESGSSAGLMTTLAIYDTLIEEDLTHGLKIAGTGTINGDGTVGAIGGVEFKLGGAVKGDADIFFVPNEENYAEAIKIKEEKNYDIEIVGIDTFDDAINYLKNIKE